MLRNLESQLIFYNNFEMQKQYKSGNFVQKLQDLLQTGTYADIITWDSNKTSIDVLDIRRMETQIIPKYFRHQKFESFVRQLNLYGFRKIKFQGRHRFTHPLLLNGQQLTSITSLKCPKSIKVSKQTVKSPCQYYDIPEERQKNHIIFNSREIAKQQQSLNQRAESMLNRDTASMQRVAGNTIMIIPANYFEFWNYMQLVGAQNLMNFACLSPVTSQQ